MTSPGLHHTLRPLGALKFTSNSQMSHLTRYAGKRAVRNLESVDCAGTLAPPSASGDCKRPTVSF